LIRLTKQSDYGIVLLAHLAAAGDTPSSAPDLASELRIPLPMVGKILKLLARAGLAASHRGVKGGYWLARAPGEISVAEIISALEGPIAMTDCTEETHTAHDCAREAFCSVRDHWQVINQAVGRALAGITLADLLRPAAGLPAHLVTLGAMRAREMR
jgi:FeS assembly SUF system regulator